MQAATNNSFDVLASACLQAGELQAHAAASIAQVKRSLSEHRLADDAATKFPSVWIGLAACMAHAIDAAKLVPGSAYGPALLDAALEHLKSMQQVARQAQAKHMNYVFHACDQAFKDNLLNSPLVDGMMHDYPINEASFVWNSSIAAGTAVQHLLGALKVLAQKALSLSPANGERARMLQAYRAGMAVSYLAMTGKSFSQKQLTEKIMEVTQRAIFEVAVKLDARTTVPALTWMHFIARDAGYLSARWLHARSAACLQACFRLTEQFATVGGLQTGVAALLPEVRTAPEAEKISVDGRCNLGFLKAALANCILIQRALFAMAEVRAIFRIAPEGLWNPQTQQQATDHPLNVVLGRITDGHAKWINIFFRSVPNGRFNQSLAGLLSSRDIIIADRMRTAGYVEAVIGSRNHMTRLSFFRACLSLINYFESGGSSLDQAQDVLSVSAVIFAVDTYVRIDFEQHLSNIVSFASAWRSNSVAARASMNSHTVCPISSYVYLWCVSNPTTRFSFWLDKKEKTLVGSHQTLITTYKDVSVGGGDQTFVAGPFNTIFDLKEAYSSVARGSLVLQSLLKERRSIAVMGFGISGAGKTSLLVGRKKETGWEKGVVYHLLESLVGQGQGQAQGVRLEGFTSVQLGPQDDGNNTSVSMDIAEGQTMDLVQVFEQVDKLLTDPSQRLTLPTPNNEVSSRTHVVISFKLRDLTAKKVFYLHLIDLAGLEKPFKMMSSFVSNLVQTVWVSEADKNATKYFEAVQKDRPKLTPVYGVPKAGQRCFTCTCYEKVLFSQQPSFAEKLGNVKEQANEYLKQVQGSKWTLVDTSLRNLHPFNALMTSPIMYPFATPTPTPKGTPTDYIFLSDFDHSKHRGWKQGEKDDPKPPFAPQKTPKDFNETSCTSETARTAHMSYFNSVANGGMLFRVQLNARPTTARGKSIPDELVTKHLAGNSKAAQFVCGQFMPSRRSAKDCCKYPLLYCMNQEASSKTLEGINLRVLPLYRADAPIELVHRLASIKTGILDSPDGSEPMSIAKQIVDVNLLTGIQQTDEYWSRVRALAEILRYAFPFGGDSAGSVPPEQGDTRCSIQSFMQLVCEGWGAHLYTYVATMFDLVDTLDHEFLRGCEDTRRNAQEKKDAQFAVAATWLNRASTVLGWVIKQGSVRPPLDPVPGPWESVENSSTDKLLYTHYHVAFHDQRAQHRSFYGDAYVEAFDPSLDLQDGPMPIGNTMVTARARFYVTPAKDKNNGKVNKVNDGVPKDADACHEKALQVKHVRVAASKPATKDCNPFVEAFKLVPGGSNQQVSLMGLPLLDLQRSLEHLSGGGSQGPPLHIMTDDVKKLVALCDSANSRYQQWGGMQGFLNDLFLFAMVVDHRFFMTREGFARFKNIAKNVDGYMDARTLEGNFIRSSIGKLREDLNHISEITQNSANPFYQPAVNKYNCWHASHPVLNTGYATKNTASAAPGSSDDRCAFQAKSEIMQSALSSQGADARCVPHMSLMSVINMSGAPVVLDPPHTPYVNVTRLMKMVEDFFNNARLSEKSLEAETEKQVQDALDPLLAGYADGQPLVLRSVRQEPVAENLIPNNTICRPENPVGRDMFVPGKAFRDEFKKEMCALYDRISCLPAAVQENLRDVKGKLDRQIKADRTGIALMTACVQGVRDQVLKPLEEHNTSSIIGNIQFVDSLRMHGQRFILDQNNDPFGLLGLLNRKNLQAVMTTS